MDLADPNLPVLGLVSQQVKAGLQQQGLPQPLYDSAAAYLDSTVGSYNNFNVSRTGYDERDVVNNNTVNVKLSGGLYYNITESIQA